MPASERLLTRGRAKRRQQPAPKKPHLSLTSQTSFAPRTDKTTRSPAQSKGFTALASKSEPTGDSVQQVCQMGAPIGRHCGPSRKVTACEFQLLFTLTK